MRPTPNSGIMDITPYVGGKSKGKSGVSVVKLSSNESPLGASPHAKEAYIAAVETLHRYPDGHATNLREAIAEICELPIENIVCGAGSDELIGLLIHAYAGAGDEVLISQHGFLMYKIYAQSFGATPVFAPEKNLTTDVDALLARITPRTKVVCIANPNNPTGSYINAAALKRLHEKLPSHVLLLVDGAYAEYADAGDYSCGKELVLKAENVVMLRTFSKIYGLSSLRIGWAFAPTHVVEVLHRIRGPFNMSTPAIEVGAAAMRDTAFTEKAKTFNRAELDYLNNQIAKLGLKVYPSIANFLLVDFKTAERAKAANDWLAERSLIVREVANYGLPTCLRISVGLPEHNRAVVAALAEFRA